MTLRKKLILIFLAVAICPMIFVGTLGYFSLFGILRNGFPDHDPTRGFELELAEGSSVGDLSVVPGYIEETYARIETALSPLVEAGMIPALIECIGHRVGQAKVFVTFDIDVVDPAFAPGTQTPAVAGLLRR